RAVCSILPAEEPASRVSHRGRSQLGGWQEMRLPVFPLPEPTVPNFEALAAECVRRRLEAHGPVPWSICEARLGEDDYRRLNQWAERVTALLLNDKSGSAGFVLLAFVAEWNRRKSPGDSVFKDLPPCFGTESARRRLFTGNNQPTQFFRRLLRQTCER